MSVWTPADSLQPKPGPGRWAWIGGITAVVLVQLVIAVLAAAIVGPMVSRTLSLASPGSLPDTTPSETLQRNSNAWLDADCDDFLSTTTVQYRNDLGFTDCARFLSSAQNALDTGTEYHVVVESEHIRGATATVGTEETYLDAESNEMTVRHYVYTLVVEDGVWRIRGDSLVDESGLSQQEVTSA